MQTTYFPNHHLPNCQCFRGTMRDVKNLLKNHGEQAAILIWKKTNGKKILHAATVQEVMMTTDFSQYCVVLFYTPEGVPNK